MRDIQIEGRLVKYDVGWYLENIPHTIPLFSFRISGLKPNVKNVRIIVKVIK